MLVTPLEVYTSLEPTLDKHNHSPQRLLIAQDEKLAPYLIVRNNKKDHGKKHSAAHFKYTDCRFATGRQPFYTEQLDQLLTKFSEGYSSAGVFINTRADDSEHKQQNMTKTVLDQLKRRLLELYITRNSEGRTKNMTVEYGFIGFSDEYCYNYSNRTRFENSIGIQMKISNVLKPVKLDKIDQAWDSIEDNHEREHPTLFVCHITDNHELESRFAWIDIPPPQDHGSYSESYAEFVNRLKIYSNPEFQGILEHSTYAMSHVLLNYFSGSYQTMVFAHFNEYAIYDTGVNFDILRYTSNLRNIKCSVNKNESGIHLLQSQNNELQHELVKQNSINDKYKISDSKNLQKLAILNKELESYKTREHILNISRNVAKAALERQKATLDLEKEDLIHQMNDLKVQLVESHIANQSYLMTIDELEQKINSEEQSKQWLTQCYADNAKYIEALEQKIEMMEDRTKSQGNNEDSLLVTLNENIKKLKDAEELNMKQLADKDTIIKKLAMEVENLTAEYKVMAGLYEFKKTQMEKRIEQLDMEMKISKVNSRKYQQQVKMDMQDQPKTTPMAQSSGQHSSQQPSRSSYAQSSDDHLSPATQIQHLNGTKQKNKVKVMPKPPTTTIPTTNIDNPAIQYEHQNHPTTSPSIDNDTNRREHSTQISKTTVDINSDNGDSETTHLPPLEKLSMGPEPPSPPKQNVSQQKHHVHIGSPLLSANLKPLQSEPREPASSLPDKKSMNLRPLSSIATNTTGDEPKANNIHKRNPVGDSHQKTKPTAEASTLPPKYLDLDFLPLGEGGSDDDLFMAEAKPMRPSQDDTGSTPADHNNNKRITAKENPVKEFPSKTPLQQPEEPMNEASQEQRTTRKKRRKLRPDKSPIDESRMSPVLNGFSAKYFETD